MNSPVYTPAILRLAASIPHYGRLPAAEGWSERRSHTCGSRVRVEVNLDAAGRVSGRGQEVCACAFGQAAAALMGAEAIGHDLAEATAARTALADWLGGRREDPGSWKGLAILEPARSRTGRHGAIMLPFEALAAAIAAALQEKPAHVTEAAAPQSADATR
jgi:NifU-like protein involved in Fe-S cluster formation